MFFHILNIPVSLSDVNDHELPSCLSRPICSSVLHQLWKGESGFVHAAYTVQMFPMLSKIKFTPSLQLSFMMSLSPLTLLSTPALLILNCIHLVLFRAYWLSSSRLAPQQITMSSVFYRATASNATHAIARPFCPSVCLSNTQIVTKRKKLAPTFLHHMKEYSS